MNCFMKRRANRYLNRYCGSFEMWCCEGAAKISWTDRVRNEEVLQRVKGSGTSYTVKRSKADWIGHILRRNCLLKKAIEGKIEGKNRSDGKTKKKA